MRVAVVGAGFSGIAASIRALKDGHDVVVYERAADFGGVWQYNTYPGAACDVPSQLYSFSFDQRKSWSRPCPPQEDILGYIHEVARDHGVAQRIRLNTEIADASWDEDAMLWRLTTVDGEALPEADMLVLACGQLSRPAWPKVEGIEEFEGHAFHSAEWDHSHDLSGRRVAVVGTGASAIQFVPAIAGIPAQMDVYQRTPAYMLPRRNRDYAPWAKALIRLVPGLQAIRRQSLTSFGESGVLGMTKFPPGGWFLRAWSALHMRRQIPDPEMRRKLTPDYPIGCKRVLFSSAWLPTLQRPDVEVVDSPIARVVADGLIDAEGVHRKADTIIYGTGFRADAFVLPMTVRGSGGRELQEAWATGAEAHRGVSVAGFPNMFVMYGPNTNLAFGSIIVMLEAQARFLGEALATLERSGAKALDVRPEVQAVYNAQLQKTLEGSVWTSCVNWYRKDGTGKVVNNWPGTMRSYVKSVERLDTSEYRLLRPAAAPEPEPAVVA